VIAEEVPFDGTFGSANFAKLVALTTDEDEANRDWATLLLGQLEIDTPELRQALLRAADDVSGIVRAEAIGGLAQRDRALALPLVKRELELEFVWLPLFEAAELVADPSLVELLRPFTEPSDNEWLDKAALAAFRACKAAL
jgi:hypothetical protein